MDILYKHKLIFLSVFMFFCTQSMAAERIIPMPKPTVDKEIKKIVAKKKEIYPQKKPDLKSKKNNSSRQKLFETFL